MGETIDIMSSACMGGVGRLGLITPSNLSVTVLIWFEMDTEKLSFVRDPPDEYLCMVCAKVLNEPQLTDCCGQHFCQACLEQWFEKQGKKVCPHCRSETFAHMRDLPLKRKLSTLKIYCPNQKEGCCLLYTSPSPRDATLSRMPSSA